MKTLLFKLTRPAKALGGDRYEYGSKETNDLIVVYIPQSITRNETSTPVPTLEISFNPKGGA